MSRIFLGKPLHWAVLVGLVILGWVTGRARLHVIEFNTFIVGLLAVTVVALLAVLATSRRGEQVTRDPLEPDDEA
jgi:hypothetical protein